MWAKCITRMLFGSLAQRRQEWMFRGGDAGADVLKTCSTLPELMCGCREFHGALLPDSQRQVTVSHRKPEPLYRDLQFTMAGLP